MEGEGCEEGQGLGAVKVPGRRGSGQGGMGVRGVTHSGVPFDMPGEHPSTQGTLHGRGGTAPVLAAGSEVRPRLEGWAGGDGGRAGRDGAGRDIPARGHDRGRGGRGRLDTKSSTHRSFQPHPPQLRGDLAVWGGADERSAVSPRGPAVPPHAWPAPSLRGQPQGSVGAKDEPRDCR